MAKWGFNRAGYWLLLRVPSSSMLFEKGASMPPPFLALSASAIVPAMWTSQQSKNVPFLSKHHWKEAGEVHLFKGGTLPVANCAHKGIFAQIHNIFSPLLCYFHTSHNHIARPLLIIMTVWKIKSQTHVPPLLLPNFFLVLIKSQHEIQHVLKSYLSLKSNKPQKTCISRAFPWPVLCLKKANNPHKKECELWDELGQSIVLFLCDIIDRQKSERPFSSLHSELKWQVARTEDKGLSTIQWRPHWS